MLRKVPLALAALITVSACADDQPVALDAALPMDSGPADATPRPDVGPTDIGASDASETDANAEDGGGPDAGGPGCEGLENANADYERYDALRACLADTTLAEPTKAALVERFLELVEANDGFPIARPSGRFIFAYLRSAEWDAEDDKQPAEDFVTGRRLEPLRVAFDLADTASSTVVLDAVHGDFFAAELVVAASAGQRYRFVAKDAQDRDWVFSDPLSRRFEFDAGGRYSIVRSAVDQGHIEWIRKVHATRLDVDRKIYLYVPPSYDQESRRYSTLYMHDGNNLFHPGIPQSSPGGTWNVHFVMQRELTGGHVRPGLIVGISNNANRFGEYTHVEDDIGGVYGGQGDDYAHFVVNDLKPIIDARYRTLTDRNNTGVMGSSLGGLISFHIGALYPETFRFVGGLSSTFIWGKIGRSNETMIERYAALTDLMERDQVFYLDSGGGPAPACPEGMDNYCETLTMRDTLVAAGVDRFPNDPDASPLPADTNIMHWWTPNAPHNEGAWFSRVHRPLRLFFRPE